MYFQIKNLIFLLIVISFFDLGESLLCWSCSNNPHDVGKNPCPDEITNFNLIQTEFCSKGTCLLKMARRDKGPLRPIKAGCVRTNKTQNVHSGKCHSGAGLEISGDKNQPKHFTSRFCTIQCDTDLCDYRIAKKFL